MLMLVMNISTFTRLIRQRPLYQPSRGAWESNSKRRFDVNLDMQCCPQRFSFSYGITNDISFSHQLMSNIRRMDLLGGTAQGYGVWVCVVVGGDENTQWKTLRAERMCFKRADVRVYSTCEL